MSAELRASLLRQARLLVQPLVNASQSRVYRQELLGALGWDLEAVTGFSIQAFDTAVSNLVDAAQQLETLAASNVSGSLRDVMDGLEAIQAVIGAVWSLTAVAAGSTIQTDIASRLAEIAGRLGNLLLVLWLEEHHPAAAATARLLTVIRAPEGQPGVALRDTTSQSLAVVPSPTSILDVGRVSKLLTEPEATLRAAWIGNAQGSAAAERLAQGLFPQLVEALQLLGADAALPFARHAVEFGTTGDQIAAASLSFHASLKPATGAGVDAGAVISVVALNDKLRLAITPVGALDLQHEGAGWSAAVKLVAAPGTAVMIGAGEVVVEPPSGGGITLSLQLNRVVAPGLPAFRVGAPGGTRFEIGAIGVAAVAAVVESPPKFDVAVRLKQATLAVSGGDGDSFLSTVLPAGGIALTFDFALGYHHGRGMYFDGGPTAAGSSGLALRLSPRLAIGPVEIPTMELALEPYEGGVQLLSTFAVSLKLGVVGATIEGVGLRASLIPSEKGNFGPVNLALGFKPPTGIGMSINAGPVRGGGYLFFDPDKREYAGVLELTVGPLTLKAIGLLSTGQPNTGFSLLVIITAEFPPLQLGFGFTLLGVGGLLGVHRGVALEPLRNGVRNHSLDAILFPKDPVANAPQLLSVLRTIFPPAQNRYTFGPMVKLGWGPNQLLEIEVALVFELPSPLRLLILGRIKAALPDKAAPVVVIKLDVVGIIDFGKGEVSVDATLYDSRIAAFSISGDMALRAGWKDNKGFALSVGGFHPKFSPPVGFPALRRLTISLAAGDNPRVRLEAYFALTSNSLQFGARLDAFVEAGPLTAAGAASFDALINFDPFHLNLMLSLGIDVCFWGGLLLHAALHADVDGPEPWHISGFIEVQTLVVSGRIAIDLTIGEPKPHEAARVDLAPILAAALVADDAWSAELPPGGAAGVTLRALPATDRLVVHPLGRFTVRQRTIPLSTPLSRFGAALIKQGTANRFDIVGVTVGGKSAGTGQTTTDDFAPGQFQDLRDEQKLSRPGFEALPSGAVATSDLFRWPVSLSGAAVVAEAAISYDEAVIDRPSGTPVNTGSRDSQNLEASLIGPLATTGAAGRSAARERGTVSGPDQRVDVVGERYVVVPTESLPLATTAGAGASSYAQLASTRGEGQLVTVGEVVP